MEIEKIKGIWSGIEVSPVKKKTIWLAFLLVMFALTGCDKKTNLYSGLPERQANSVISALLERGISCEKTAGEEGTWNVIISEKNFAEAAVLLEQKGLPQRVYQGVGDVFKKTGMVSSPSEERIRFMEALAQDLSRTISQIEGVIDARVHVVLPENNPFAKNVLPSSAAVAIRHRYDVNMIDHVPQIKNLVKNSIEGLAYEKISVTLFSDSPEAPFKPVYEEEKPFLGKQLMQILSAVNAAILIGLLGIAGYVFFTRRKASNKEESGTRQQG